ncbi:uncharacterized protein LOC111627213 [Centruroides sculpturatus]|uniref:uncharacterized protein LOC111615381 n=1 Tax=Centruroides sculpturatus TaxID=218467 RepID=UPI000C6CA2FF|nr:uncharacterized protein LOC111615381 [Centruroides sculpturatus]XP_023226551.1 uncharacterized protein LOC111627213 [Centruroides sculpturatus]
MAGQKILVVGTGAMGCAIAQAVVDKNGGPVWIYGVDQQELTDLKSGFNRRYFQNHRFSNLVVTDNLSEAVQDARHIFLAVPSKVLGEVYQKISDLIGVKKTAILVNLAKGFYPGSSQTAHAFLTQKIRQDRVFRGLVSLYGPSFASEIVERKLTFLAAVSSDQKLSREIQALLSNDYLKIFLEKDALGAQVGAIYKNVVAIASGLLAGLGYGLNAQAVVLTQGF